MSKAIYAKNVTAAARAIRIIIGLALLSLVFLRQDSSRWLGLIGLVLLLTASLSWCPLYTLLGVKTCPMTKQWFLLQFGVTFQPAGYMICRLVLERSGNPASGMQRA